MFYVGITAALVWVEYLLFRTESSVLAGLVLLALIVPNIAVTARRLHDTDKSGWLQLISIIPLIGPILLIVWLASRGDATAPTAMGRLRPE